MNLNHVYPVNTGCIIANGRYAVPIISTWAGVPRCATSPNTSLFAISYVHIGEQLATLVTIYT